MTEQLNNYIRSIVCGILIFRIFFLVLIFSTEPIISPNSEHLISETVCLQHCNTTQNFKYEIRAFNASQEYRDSNKTSLTDFQLSKEYASKAILFLLPKSTRLIVPNLSSTLITFPFHYFT